MTLRSAHHHIGRVVTVAVAGSARGDIEGLTGLSPASLRPIGDSRPRPGAALRDIDDATTQPDNADQAMQAGIAVHRHASPLVASRR